MKIMKRPIKNLWITMIMFMLFTATLFTGCKKDAGTPVDQTYDMSINVNSVFQNGLK